MSSSLPTIYSIFSILLLVQVSSQISISSGPKLDTPPSLALWARRPPFGNECMHKCLDGDNRKDIVVGVLTSDQIRVKTISWLFWEAFNVTQLTQTCSTVWSARGCLKTCLNEDNARPLSEVMKMVHVLESVCASNPLSDHRVRPSETECIRNSLNDSQEWCGKSSACHHMWNTSDVFLANEDPLDHMRLIQRGVILSGCYCRCVRPALSCKGNLKGAHQREIQAFEYLNDLIYQHNVRLPLVESCQSLMSGNVSTIESSHESHEIPPNIKFLTKLNVTDPIVTPSVEYLFPIWAWIALLLIFCAIFVILFAWRTK